MKTILKHLATTHLSEAVELVDNVPNAVEIASNDNSTIRCIALKAGTRIPEHNSPYDTVLVMLKGHMHLNFGSDTVELKTGDATLIPAQIMHDVKALEETRFLLNVMGE